MLVLVVSAASAHAAPGDLDPSFSGDGKQTLDFGGNDRATHVVVAPSGRLVVVGATDAIGGGDFAVGRLTAGGAPDGTFGSGGKVTSGTDPAVEDVGGGVVVLPDESVLVAGFGGTGKDFVVKRLGSDGAVADTKRFDFGGVETVTAMVAQPDGKLVLVGSTSATGGGDFAILRLNADLTPDTSFDTDGKQTVDFGGAADAANAVAIQPDGKIVVAGQANGVNGDAGLVRLNTDGSIDTSFAPASNGKATVDFGGADVANGVAVQPDGKIVLAGTTSAAGAGDVAVARLDAAGALDPSFSGDGKLTLGNALASDSGLALAIQRNGRIVVLAQGDSAAKGDFELFRLATDGSADASFGSGGTRNVDFGGAEFDGDVVIQPDGKIVIAGSTDANPGGYDIALARIEGDPVATGPGNGQPGGGPTGPPPSAGRIGVGSSKKLPGATRLSGAGALARDGAKLISWHWVITGGGQKLDADCGRSPILSAILPKRGTYNARLTVTDSRGRVGASLVSLVIRKALNFKSKGIFDCENPAKGNQPDRADCVKTYGFGILQVGSRGAADDCFEIGQSTKDGQKYIEGKIAGPVAINGLYVPVPKSVKTVYDSTGNVSVDGANRLAVKIGPFLTKEFDLRFRIDPNKLGVYHLVNVDQSANTPKLLGSLPIRGAFSIDLLYHRSKTKIGVGLPSPFSFGGKSTAQADVKLIADNTRGLRYDGLSATVPQVWLGPIFVSGLNFNYEQSSNSWGGGAKITLPGSRIAIDARGPPSQPPDFGFGIRKGKLHHAGFGVEFQPPTQPDLFPPFHTVLLQHIGAAIGFNPLRLTGRIGISAANIVEEDGVLFGAFATSRQRYTMPEDPGPELAPLAQRTFDRFSLAIGGTAKLKVPVLKGDIPLLNAYALYMYPSYLEFGGGFKYGIGPLSIDGNVGGFAYGANRTFNLEGGIKACLRGIKIGYKIFSVKISPCLNVGGVVSSRGIGFCTVLPVPFPVVGSIPVTIGAGYHWGDGFPKIMLFSCDYGPYRQVSAFARRAGTGSGGAVTLPGGLPAAMIRVRGQGAAPELVVRDPQGRSIADSADAVTMQGSEPDTTLVALKRPRAGRWTIAAAPGSAPIASVASAAALPPVAIRARVTGSGSRRTLRYRLSAAPGRKVTFLERGPSTARVLGVARGSAGSLSFTPGTGRTGRRSIVASVETDGAPARSLRVASFVAPRPALPGRPARVTVKRVRGAIRISWRRVRGAARYEVLVRLSDRSQAFRVARGTRVTVPDPSPRRRGAVLVSVLQPDGTRGSARAVKVKAVRSRRR